MMVIVLVVLISLFIIVGMMELFLEYVATDFKYKKITIGKECIYLKYKVYTNDNPKIFISTSKSRFINLSTDYIYPASSELYYYIQNDTLFIINYEIADQPARFRSKMIIIQKKISNPESTDLYYKDNYRTFGYKKFPNSNER